MDKKLVHSCFTTYRFKLIVAFVLVPIIVSHSYASETLAIDSFSDKINNDRGMPRQYFNYSMSGGKTSSVQEIKAGVIHLTGNIEPPRGQSGWASTVLPLTHNGLAVDASEYSGVRLKVKINQGMVSLSANSTEIENFDYHSALVSVPIDGNFHNISIPFDSMKRTWSEQTQLNKDSINSISIIAFSMQKAAYDFEIDEITFY